MASDLGFLVIQQVDQLDRGGSRQIFYPKFILWAVSFPTYVLSLGLLSGVSWTTIVYHVFLSWIWILGYLTSSFTVSNYKWGFYAFSTIAWIFLATGTLTEGLRHAKRVGVSRDYLILAGWVNLLWLQYPLAFGLTDAGNRIGVVGGFIWFGILDVLMIPVSTIAILAFSRRWDYGRLNIAFTQYGRVKTTPGTFPEKEAATGPAGGVTTDAPVHTGEAAV